MIVQHNISALNANRQLNIVQKMGSKSAEKLSSGYRINRAADDAAGLSISEKMRKQIRGLTKAKENVEDGISLCQVADGAMAEMHDMTNRMNELCVQAANGTNSADDRAYIQMEINNIVEEFGRIINTTKFNEVYIFKGDEPFQALAGSELEYGGKRGTGIGAILGITAYSGKKIDDKLTEDVNDTSTWRVTQPSNTGTILTKFPYPGNANDGRKSAWIDFTEFKANSKTELISKLNGEGFDWSCGYCDLHGSIKFVSNVTNNHYKTSSEIFYDYYQLSTAPSHEMVEIDINSIWEKYQSTSSSLGEIICETLVDVLNAAGDINPTTSRLTRDLVEFGYKKGTGRFYIFDASGSPFSTYPDISEFNVVPRSNTGALESGTTGEIKPLVPKAKPITTKQLAIHAGADADGTNKVIMKMPTFKNENLKINSISVLTEDLATNSIDVLTDVLHVISANRSRIGAYQNRLEHTSLNLDNVVENTTDSESKLRDTNMAKEMVWYSNNNILTQAGQSMLSQANNSHQNILSLLTA